MRHCKKSQKLSAPAIARGVGIGAPLLGDKWVTELARTDVKDQNHPDNRARCNDLGNISIAGHKVTSCVISVRFVSVNKL